MHEYFGFECEIVSLAGAMAEPYPVATSVMMLDPDLVISSPGVSILDVMWDMGYEGLAAQYGPIMDLSLFEQLGWDKCKGMIFFYPEWYGAEEVWPEAVACAGEYEARYSVEMPTRWMIRKKSWRLSRAGRPSIPWLGLFTMAVRLLWALTAC
jgi:hypothetical protein